MISVYFTLLSLVTVYTNFLSCTSLTHACGMTMADELS